jgi:hypothetical protein
MLYEALIWMIEVQIESIYFGQPTFHLQCECTIEHLLANGLLLYLLLIVRFPTIYNEGVLQMTFFNHHFQLAVREKSRRKKEIEREGRRLNLFFYLHRPSVHRPK